MYHLNHSSSARSTDLVTVWRLWICKQMTAFRPTSVELWGFYDAACVVCRSVWNVWGQEASKALRTWPSAVKTAVIAHSRFIDFKAAFLLFLIEPGNEILHPNSSWHPPSSYLYLSSLISPTSAPMLPWQSTSSPPLQRVATTTRLWI